MKNPKVDVDNRIVCIYIEKIGIYFFEKINKREKISKKNKLPSVSGENFSNAVDRANEEGGLKIKKTKFRSIIMDQSKYNSWNEYVLATFKKAKENENTIN